MRDVSKKLTFANAHNVAPKVRTIHLWGRVVWDKGPVVQLRLPWFDEETQQQRILELMLRKPWARLNWYTGEGVPFEL